MSEITTRSDVERLCWHLSGWSVEQRSVNRLMAAIDAYAAGVPLADAVAEPDGGVQAPAEPSAMLETPAAVIGPQNGAQGIEGAYMLTLTRVDTPARTGPHRDSGDGGRTCRKCNERKALTEFNLDPHSPGGRKTACKACENKRKRDARALKKTVGKATARVRGT
jgi:hypothetical protein